MSQIRNKSYFNTLDLQKFRQLHLLTNIFKLKVRVVCEAACISASFYIPRDFCFLLYHRDSLLSILQITKTRSAWRFHWNSFYFIRIYQKKKKKIHLNKPKNQHNKSIKNYPNTNKQINKINKYLLIWQTQKPRFWKYGKYGKYGNMPWVVFHVRGMKRIQKRELFFFFTMRILPGKPCQKTCKNIQICHYRNSLDHMLQFI